MGFKMSVTLLSFLIVFVLLRCSECAAGSRPTEQTMIYPWPLPHDRQPLFFSLITSFSGRLDSSGVVPGVNVALDIINSNDSNLLNGYSLHYILSDSKCQKTPALDAFFHQILSETQYRKLAVIGAGCSPATEPTAEISHQFNITQLSCASASPVLSDRRRFRKYFQLLPSMVNIAYGYIGVFRYYSWKQVTLIVQEENVFTEMTKQLKDLLEGQNIVYAEYTFSSNIGLSDLSVEPFTVSDERIYIIVTYENYARALLCEAFDLGIRYPTHLLLTFHWYEERWWLKDNGADSDVKLNCTAEERESVLVHSLGFNFILPPGHLKNLQNVTTDVGISGEEYLTMECGHLGVAPYNFNHSPFAQYCFDAVLTLAYALNQTLTDVDNSDINARLASAYGLPNGSWFGLEDFNYRSDALTSITFGYLHNTSFNGITRDVSFDENGIRTKSYPSVFQFRTIEGGSLNWVKVGSFVMLEGSDDYNFVIDGHSGNMLNASWPNGIPFDGVPTEDIATAFIPLVIVIYIFAAAGVIFSIVCLAFNCIFRNKKLIRLSSPKLNIITIFGGIILYVSMVLFVIPTHSKSAIHGLCIARLWFLALGVSLAFGTIIMKMFRVFIIFSNPTPKRKKFLKDWMLAVGVLIMVIVDLVVLIIFTAVVSGLKVQLVRRVPHREIRQSVTGDVRHVTENFIHICQSTEQRIAVVILSVYKLLLQLLAFILAICTQRIKIKGLNEAKFIIAAVYASSFGLVLAALTHFVLVEYENVHAVLFAVALGFSATAILGLLFIPKMIGLHKDPKGENVFINSASRDVGSLLNVGSLPAQQQQQQQQRELQLSTEDTLRRRIKQLENLLSTYTSTGNESAVNSTSDSTKLKANGEQECRLGVSDNNDMADKDSEIIRQQTD